MFVSLSSSEKKTRCDVRRSRLKLLFYIFLFCLCSPCAGLANFNGDGGSGGIFKADGQPTFAKPFSGKCEERNGRYSIADQCDKYVECTDGEPKESLCPDGLMFNDKLKLFSYPCQYPIDVDCGSRAKLQPPQVHNFLLFQHNIYLTLFYLSLK